MRNEEELMLHYQRHADLLKTEKKIYGYEQSKGRIVKHALLNKDKNKTGVSGCVTVKNL